VQLCNAVHRLASDNGEIRHADRTLSLFTNERHTPHLFVVVRKLSADVIKEPPIDLEDDFQMPGKQFGK
jgi:hypothetical protein